MHKTRLRITPGLCGLLLLALTGTGSAHAFEDPLLNLSVPALSPPQGRVVNVSTARALYDACKHIKKGDTIVVANGTYRVPDVLVLNRTRDVTIRGASDDPSKVVLQGKGWDDDGQPRDTILQIEGCENVTVAHLTFEDAHNFGVHVCAYSSPRNVTVYHCYFRNIGQRALKGSGSKDGSKAKKGLVRYCHFQNTKIPPAGGGRKWFQNGNYISAIDMMDLEEWTFCDNVFRDIKGQSGSGRGAIFIWVRSKKILIERNLMVDCDRGIGLGNPSPSSNHSDGMLHLSDSICRNNMIVAGPDAGIEMAWVKNVKVYHNTVWRREDPDGRGIRLIEKIWDADIANNLVRGRLFIQGGEARVRGNLAVGLRENWFVDMNSGDLRLTKHARAAMNAGVKLDEAKADFFGTKRDERPDIGAHEWTKPDEKEK